VLEDHLNPPAELGFLETTCNVVAIKDDFTGCRSVEANEDPTECCLAASRLADQANCLAAT
ncbi:uncharacterized protein METZ01_LOCUS87878, partial [marine metagenome]